VTNAEGAATTLTTRVTSAETAAGTLTGRVTAAETAATALALRVTKAESLTPSSSNLVTAVLALQTADTNIQSAATALATRVSAAEDLSATGTTLATRIASHVTSLASLGTRLSTAELAVAVSGMILMWSGVTPPANGALCDGAGGRPDLRNRFIVGAGSSYASGATGGASSSTPTISVAGTAITTAQMPWHNHGGNTGGVSSTIGTDGARDYNNLCNDNEWTKEFAYQWSATCRGNLFSWHTHSINAEGGGQAHSHGASSSAVPTIPPFYALAYIIKL